MRNEFYSSISEGSLRKPGIVEKSDFENLSNLLRSGGIRFYNILKSQYMETRDESRKPFVIIAITSAIVDLIERLYQAGDNGHGIIGSNENCDIFDRLDLIRLLIVNDTVTLGLIDD